MSSTTSQVMTVTGPVAELGRVLPHEHVFLDLYRVFQPHREMKLFDKELAAREVGVLAAGGLTTLVELSTADLGRDPVGLREVSERTGVQIVMGSGWYRETFYPTDLWTWPTARLAEELIRDIETGVDGICPGIIGEIGTHAAHVSPVEERVHRAAARAHLATGLTISTHSNATPVGLAQLDVFEEEGVPLDRVVIGHCDTYPFPEHHLQILDRGAWVQFDTIRGAYEFETERQIDLICALLERGHIGRLLLSQDIAVDRLLKAYGGNGYDYLFTEFADRLRERGLSSEELTQIFETNPYRMLTGS